MPSQKNINQVASLKEKLEKAKSIVLADYKGLNVGQMTELRKKVKEAGGEFKVIKNTLLKLGFENFQFPISNFQFTGPTAILFSYDDEVAPIKTLYDFFKENELPKIKIGFLDGSTGSPQVMEEEKVIELAKLPSHQQLQAQLLNTLNSPIYGFTYVLKGNLASLINVLKAIKDAKHAD